MKLCDWLKLRNNCCEKKVLQNRRETHDHITHSPSGRIYGRILTLAHPHHIVTDKIDYEAESKRVEAAYRALCPKDFMTFMRGLVIPSAHGPKIFDACLADFQRECFTQLAPSLHAVRDGNAPAKRRFWIERTKKASKDGDLAACLLWLCCFPERPLYIQVGAADKDQAGIIKRRIEGILYYNRWLEDYVTGKNYEVKHNGGLAVIDIIAADVAGSHGETPDVLVVNELSHVTKWEFVENLLDNADGVPRGIVIVATNAGFKGTKAETWRNNAIQNPKKWSSFILDSPAPWHSAADLEDAKARNSLSRYNRLWWGKWSSGKGDALSEDDIEYCFSKGLGPVIKAEKGWIYLMGIDLGVKHDHAGIVVLGVHEETQRCRLARFEDYEPDKKTGRVDLIHVEERILKLFKLFRATWVGYDPTQAELMAQRLTKKGLPMFEMTFSSGANLTAMAEAMVKIVSERKLDAYDDNRDTMKLDLGKLSIVEKTYGYKLEAVSDETGHADVATALAITLPRAVALLQGRLGLSSDDTLMSVLEQEDELNSAEVKDLPDELREICEMYGSRSVVESLQDIANENDLNDLE